MKQNKIALKTLAMKAKVANYIRHEFFPYSKNEWAIAKKGKKDFKTFDKDKFIEELYDLVLEMSADLKSYKWKREYQAKLLEKRLAAPQTKTMLKKLSGKTKKNLVVSK